MFFRYFLSLLLLCFGLNALTAQDCNFQLLLEDTLGDGWDGSQITVSINGVDTTLMMNLGREQSVFLPVSNGDVVTYSFTGGAFPEENSFFFIDNNDSLYVSENAFDADNLTASGSFTVACVRCAPPAENSFEFFRLRATSVDVRFRALPAAELPRYRLSYRGGDYDPESDNDGITIVRADTTFRINGLAPDSLYTFWLDAICDSSNNTAAARGPFTVTTPKTNDVGVTQLASPVNGCALSAEEVTIGITNFGGAPQAFFDVNYSINGRMSSVMMPDDGIYTGVLGVDSTELFTFDLRAFLDTPGTYEFKLWTELEGDEVPENDTLTVSVINIPQISTFPYYENFEESNGFWYPGDESVGFRLWEWGTPDADLIDRAPEGRNAWVTDLDDDYFGRQTTYLYSPCFDLSGMTGDPLFSCQLFVDTEETLDGVFLEITTDDGETWSRVETSPAGVNWYNNLEEQRWSGDGGFGGRFATVAQLLENVAGSRIQVRIGLFSDSFFADREGVLIDAVTVTERRSVNLSAGQASSVNPSSCSSVSDSVRFRFTNIGIEPAENTTVNYRVNGGEIVTETLGRTLQAGQSTIYMFTTPFNGTLLPESLIEVWTADDEDFQANNDTTKFFLYTRDALPFFEGFDRDELLNGWMRDFSFNIGDRNSDGNRTLYTNLYSAVDTARFQTANYGFVEAGDSLRFTITFNDFEADSIPYSGPVPLQLLAFPNCTEDTIVLLDLTMMGDSAFVVPLDDYVGSSLRFDFLLRWIEGDFYADIDDVNVARCGADLGLEGETTNASNAGAVNGAALVRPGSGLAPFTYLWSSGDSTALVENLPPGDYTVTVTDAVGCGDELTVTVDFNTSNDQPTEVLDGLTVFPNPTTGMLELRLDLPSATNLRSELYDLAGRRLIARDFGRGLHLSERLDLGRFPAGVYLLRLRADEGARTVRVIKR